MIQALNQVRRQAKLALSRQPGSCTPGPWATDDCNGQLKPNMMNEGTIGIPAVAQEKLIMSVSLTC